MTTAKRQAALEVVAEGRGLDCATSQELLDEISRLEETATRWARLYDAAKKRDWRVGMAATPKMRSHTRHKTVGIIRRIHPEAPGIKQMAEIEIYRADEPNVFLLEPMDDWMTA